MARIIVGADESAGDVAARLLELADHQNDVQTRTDGPGMSFEVPEKVYQAYTAKGGDRPEPEQRANSVQRMLSQQGADDPDAIRSDDELPEGARIAEPGTGADDIAGEIVADELPDSAVVVDPPGNGDAPDAGDQGDEPEPESEPDKPAPRKRTSRARKSTSKPAPAGSNE